MVINQSLIVRLEAADRVQTMIHKMLRFYWALQDGIFHTGALLKEVVNTLVHEVIENGWVIVTCWNVIPQYGVTNPSRVPFTVSLFLSVAVITLATGT